MTENDRLEYHRAVLSTFDRPGGARRYQDRAQAREMRKLYQRAYSALYRLTPKGIAHSRNKDSRRRLNPQRRLRQSRTESVSRFYARMLSAKQAACFYCEQPLQPHERVGDHFVPLAKGGEHAEHNLVVACRACNQEKSDQLPADFIASRYFG